MQSVIYDARVRYRPERHLRLTRAVERLVLREWPGGVTGQYPGRDARLENRRIFRVLMETHFPWSVFNGKTGFGLLSARRDEAAGKNKKVEGFLPTDGPPLRWPVPRVRRTHESRHDHLSRLCLLSSQVKFLLSTHIQNSPPLVPGAGSLRRRRNLSHPGAR